MRSHELMTRDWLGFLPAKCLRFLSAGNFSTFLESKRKAGYWSGEKGPAPETLDYRELIARVTSHIPD